MIHKFLEQPDDLLDVFSKLTNIDEDIEVVANIVLDNQNFQSRLNITHELPNKSSNIKLKFVLYGNSKVTLPVDILVKKGALNTSTNFSAIVYIMDKDSKAEITPALFIHEKNIQKAGHGLVIKNIKPVDTIYFQARGIGAGIAKKLIVGI